MAGRYRNRCEIPEPALTYHDLISLPKLFNEHEQGKQLFSHTYNKMSTDDPRKAAKRLNGHVGHLTPEQSEAFTAFKSILQKNNLYTPANEEISKPSDDDATLLCVY